MSRYEPPPTPDGLGASGLALWEHVSQRFDVSAEQDRLQLLQVCRTADLCDELEAVVAREGVTSQSSQGLRTHPSVIELRHQRITLARLMAALGVPSESSARGVYSISA